MRSKTGFDAALSPAPASSGSRGVLADITGEELKRVAIDVVREHRRRLDQAQHVFEEIERLETAGSSRDELADLRHDYRMAMLNLHAQHQLVRMIVDQLGYVPEVDGHRPLLN